jgi:hypothetical protein
LWRYDVIIRIWDVDRCPRGESTLPRVDLGIVPDDNLAVRREVKIEFKGGHAKVKRHLERGKGVLRPKPT